MPPDLDGLIDSLTREEKLSLVCGDTDPAGTATGYLAGVDRLDIPPVRFVDGPLGIRVPERQSTAFPAPIAVAATFDPSLAVAKGKAMAREALAHDQDVLLAPALNLLRVPQWGRSFECYSEDPLLTGAFAAGSVRGIQSEDVLATPKHYVGNNQETHRARVSAEMDERTLRECYLPGFRDAVDAGAGAVMAAYNRVNGTYMSENRRLLTEILKQEWGFEGFVVSDWYGTESTVAAANAGLDVEMPGTHPDEMIGEITDTGESAVDFSELADGMPDPTNVGQFAEPLADAIAAGDVPQRRLDDMVKRVLGGLADIGRLDGHDPDGALDTPEHRELARRLAIRGTVLLENDGCLPLDPATDVALLGPNIHDTALGGGGSSETTPVVETTTAAGVRDRGESVTCHQGHSHIDDISFFDVVAGSGGVSKTADLAEEEHDIAEAAAVAADADVAVVVVRDRVTEAMDRETLSLPGKQDELVETVAKANDRTVVVCQTSGPVEMPWRDAVAAVLLQWYPGQADGDALAAVLFGDAEPGGRLPVSFAPAEAYPTTAEERFPGIDHRAEYAEGVFVGYRHFDREGIGPTFPFGHGNSYTTFAYRDGTAVDPNTVAVTVENTGDRKGREVVQAYVKPGTSSVERPVRELAGFTAVEIPAGEQQTVHVDLDERAFGYYDDGWKVEGGSYTVEIGRSSRNCRETVSVERPEMK